MSSPFCCDEMAVSPREDKSRAGTAPLGSLGTAAAQPAPARQFPRNRRGYWSFWIFPVLFVVSLFAEFIANDRPIVASYKGELLFPIFVDYPEEKFGGFLAQTDYRDPLISGEIEAHGWMIWPPIRYSYNTHNPRPADAGALAADLDAFGGAVPRKRRREAEAAVSRITAAAISSGIGSAPTIRAATSSRGSSTASASRFCSG